jgi:hypothetical protein
MEAWKPLNQWDHPEIAAAMRNLGEVIREEAALESLMAGAKGSLVLISGTLGFVRKLLTWLMDLGKAPILIFVEGVWEDDHYYQKALTWSGGEYPTSEWGV